MQGQGSCLICHKRHYKINDTKFICGGCELNVSKTPPHLPSITCGACFGSLFREDQYSTTYVPIASMKDVSICKNCKNIKYEVHSLIRKYFEETKTEQIASKPSLSDLIETYKVDIPDTMFDRHGNPISTTHSVVTTFEPLFAEKTPCVKLLLPQTSFKIRSFVDQTVKEMKVKSACLYVSDSGVLGDMYVVDGDYVKILELTVGSTSAVGPVGSDGAPGPKGDKCNVRSDGQTVKF